MLFPDNCGARSNLSARGLRRNSTRIQLQRTRTRSPNDPRFGTGAGTGSGTGGGTTGGGTTGGGASSTATPTSTNGIPHSSHVVLVIEENHMFTEIYPNGMPWLVAQGNKYGYTLNYHANSSGSMLDYLWLSSGSCHASDGS